MDTIRIDEVELLKGSPECLLGAALDAPRAGDVCEGQIIELTGWVAGSTSKTTGVRINRLEEGRFSQNPGRPLVRPLVECGSLSSAPMLCGNPDSRNRWRKELSPALQQAYRDIFGDFLRELGYA